VIDPKGTIVYKSVGANVPGDGRGAREGDRGARK
jgi:hypothetical protein